MSRRKRERVDGHDFKLCKFCVQRILPHETENTSVPLIRRQPRFEVLNYDAWIDELEDKG